MAKPILSSPFAAWERFIQSGTLDADTLRPEIAQAWLRCREAGIDPFQGRSTRQLAGPELELLLEKRKSLIDVARPFMGNLYQFVASSSFVVLLCDERGYILETVGDPEVIKNAPDLNFGRGAVWTEAEIGNNGAGTSLQLRRPFQVSGGEHYCLKHHPWTCSGAPIFDESETMIGVLEMTGPVEATHQHTLGMVVAAAEAIRQQLRVQLKNRELRLLNRHLSNLFLTVSDGVVVLDNLGVIQQVNPVAETIFKSKAEALVGSPFAQYIDKREPVTELLRAGRAFNDLELNLGTRSEFTACLASAKPVKDEQDRITSAVIFLNPIHRINKLINRFSGAHATFTFDDIIGSGQALAKAVQLGIQAASSESTVLLRGESGTGKEMFAQAIHNRSARRQGPFIAINCGAIPRELVGSELFGYVEGAFTGAHKRGRPGKFELAAGGTLFLDEIGDMPLDQQVSLLRVLQDKSITRIGGDKALLVDVRIICATNKDLLQEIAQGNFRQDLYYRLNVISLQLPPLREQRSDIPMLFRIFYERICQKLGVHSIPVDPAVIARLQQYDWPGNMREFQNAVEKLVNLSSQYPIGINSLPDEILARSGRPAPHPPTAPAEPSLREHRIHIKQVLAEQERKEILERMALHGGNISLTARAMGISRTSLYRKLAKP
ncbi:MAG: sigma-54-dependent Fis family transcriptional regulator [Holophaga sp.]|nr:sigma-54-dependent Fis family transcriptional regulator [Holophaga sp.]